MELTFRPDDSPYFELIKFIQGRKAVRSGDHHRSRRLDTPGPGRHRSFAADGLVCGTVGGRIGRSPGRATGLRRDKKKTIARPLVRSGARAVGGGGRGLRGAAEGSDRLCRPANSQAFMNLAGGQARRAGTSRQPNRNGEGRTNARSRGFGWSPGRAVAGAPRGRAWPDLRRRSGRSSGEAGPFAPAGQGRPFSRASSSPAAPADRRRRPRRPGPGPTRASS